MKALERLVEDQITVLKGNARLAAVWVLSLLATGLVATAALYNLPGTRSLSDVTKLGPGLIGTAISSLQYKTIAVLRERLSFYRTLRSLLVGFADLTAAEQEKITDIVTDAIKESAKR